MQRSSWYARIKPFEWRTPVYPTVKRCCELVLIAAIAAFVTTACLSLAAGAVTRILNIPSEVLVAEILALLLLVGWLCWGRWKAITGYRSFLAYPPTWLAIVLGLILVSIAFSNIEGLAHIYERSERTDSLSLLSFSQYNRILILFSALLSGILIPTSFAPRRETSQSDEIPTGLTAKELDSWKLPAPPTWEGWRGWVKDDDSVKDPDSDIFRYQHIAQRIVRRLLSSEKPPAQAVIGELGAGKSSIGNLVEWELRNRRLPKRIRFIRVGLWQYENARAAVRGLVKELVTVLEKEVAAFGLSELPAQYVEAMSAAGGGWSGLSRLFGWSAQPLDALRHIDEVACALRINLVLWVEDLERYAGLAGKPGGPLTPEEFERVGPIRSLIYSLNKLKSVSIILATTMPNDQMDLEKIALHVEEIPDLDPVKVREVIGGFRRAAFNNFPNLIDPSEGEGRDDLNLLDRDATFLFAKALSEGKFYYMSQALPLLCRNPRILKQSLRRCFEFWDANPGEIDFDALLVGSILYYFDPVVFNFMRENAIQWLGRPSRELYLTQSKAEDPSPEFLKKLGYSSVEIQAIQRAFYFLLGTEDFKTRLQGFSASHGNTKYWDRFLSNPYIPKEDSDQELLHILQDGNLEILLDKVEGPHSPSVEHFSKLLPAEIVYKLLLKLVDRRKNENYSAWVQEERMGIRDHAPGLIPIWRIWLTRHGYPEFMNGAIDTLKKAIEIAIPVNLALAVDLEYFFVIADSRTGSNFLQGQDRERIPELKAFLRVKMVEAYEGKPELLTERLTGLPTQFLLWLCWGLDEVRKGQLQGLPFTQWTRFRAVLLDALQQAPNVLLPHIAGLVLDYVSTFGGEKYTYNPELDRRLFDGEARGKLLDAMAQDSPHRNDPLLKALIDFDPTSKKIRFAQLLEPELAKAEEPNSEMIEKEANG
jgi:hypothetical protein